MLICNTHVEAVTFCDLADWHGSATHGHLVCATCDYTTLTVLDRNICWTDAKLTDESLKN